MVQTSVVGVTSTLIYVHIEVYKYYVSVMQVCYFHSVENQNKILDTFGKLLRHAIYLIH